MQKIQTYLRKLATKRARAAGDVERYSKAAELSAGLLAKAQSVLCACDVLIAEYDERLGLSVIESIKTGTITRESGGSAGNPSRYSQISLAKVADADEICDEVEARWKLEFIIPASAAPRQAQATTELGRLVAASPS